MMKKTLLIAGVVLLAVGALALAFAALNLFGYYHVPDGSPALYDSLRRRSVLFFALGGLLLLGGAVCLFFRFKR